MSDNIDNENTRNPQFFDVILSGLIDPFVFLVSIGISCLLVLFSLQAALFRVFSIFDFANDQMAISQAMSVFVPICTLALLSLSASRHKPRASKFSGAEIKMNFSRIVVGAILLILLLINAYLFQRHFAQTDLLDQAELWDIKMYAGVTVIVATIGITIDSMDTAFHSHVVETLEGKEDGSGNGPSK